MTSFLYEYAGIHQIDYDASTVNGLKSAVENMVFTTSDAKLKSWREGLGVIEVTVHRVTPSCNSSNTSDHHYVVQSRGKAEPAN
jgi:hypothetical protein